MADARDAGTLVGWKEYLDFPEWGIGHVEVKIDTGARTCALGAVDYDLVEVPGKGQVVDLRLALYRRHPERLTRVRAAVLGTVPVRNTSGVYELRPLVETEIRLGPVRKRVTLTVADRSRMCFPVLLGRKALEGDFLVDVSRKYLLREKA